MPSKLLIVDDEDMIRWSLSESLTQAGYKTVVAEDLPSAVRAMERESPDLVLTDLRLGATSGLDVLREARRFNPGLPIILMTAFADFSSAVEALRGGAADYISKPLQLAGLKITLQRVLETANLRRRLNQAHERRRDRYGFDTIVCASPAMREAVATARKIADSRFGTVLILGASGCGKDHLARAIHYESSRASEPLMEINCTAIPDALLESELFGHEKGAFTDAARQKKGLFELADGGTVFLNEIGHMPPSLQAKLLRFLEEKTFRRVGGTEDIVVDVRIIAATNEDLERAVAKRSFRSDLYYRINVLTIRLRPLRERQEDIMPLIDVLLERLCKELGKPRLQLRPQCLASMREYAWPGNVRELRNALERIVILGESQFRPLAPPPGADDGERGLEPGFMLPSGGVRLDEVEKTLVQQALTQSKGNQQKAAELLGIGRDALRRRIDKFGLRALACALLALAWHAGPARAWFGGGAKKEDPFLVRHADKARELQAQPGAHAPVLEGACSKCHASVSDPTKLVMEYKALCLSCHAPKAADLKKAVVHPPFRDGDCSVCHQPHASDQPPLLNDKVNSICLTCHALDGDAVKQSHFAITSIEAECTLCHNPHASANAKLIREEKQHLPFEARSCEACHDPTGPDGKAKLKDPLGPACIACHSDKDEILARKVVHPPFKAGTCAKCHFPHVARYQALLKAPVETVCRKCHATIPDRGHPTPWHPTFKPGRMNPLDGAKPFNCAACHDPHGSDFARLRRFDAKELCNKCHQN